ncbi:hypothetical protein ENKNEFLB_04094 [Nocardioides aquaticus]|uniref:Uncharacterized protein n=1 Tax=Nocardioides aquaticus TaxID=160826 RepID=A0ABX8ERL5_9ACTN|nr:hypothetical protein ENKNEFLB_04094 [Nocardioides aquaticus]
MSNGERDPDEVECRPGPGAPGVEVLGPGRSRSGAPGR